MISKSILVSLLFLGGALAAADFISYRDPAAHNNDIQEPLPFVNFEEAFDTVDCNSTGPTCRSDCVSVEDGYYQWCGNCSNFLGCFDEVEYYGLCPGLLQWDDAITGCTEQSNTCDECYVAPRCNSTGITCIRNCTGMTDNEYQLCHNCTSYGTCNHGTLTVEHCPAGQVWDNYEPKGCSDTSHTCTECYEHVTCESTGPSCITDCTGFANGNYQMCSRCSAYVICSSGQAIMSFCPSETYWDDNQLGCFSTSDTCRQCDSPNKCTSTGEDCVVRCNGLDDGYYQACANCSYYIHCVGGHTEYERCSPSSWYWDQTVRSCLPVSTTCTECETYQADGKLVLCSTECVRTFLKIEIWQKEHIWFGSSQRPSSYGACHDHL